MKLKYKYLIALGCILLVFVLCFALLGGYGEKAAELLSDTNLPALDTETQAHANAVVSGRSLGILSLIPVLVTVVLAFTLKDVLISLITGILSGFAIWWGAFGDGNFFVRLGGVFNSTCQNLLNTVSDEFHAAIIVLCLAIGGMVAVINSSGGFAALAYTLTKNINSPKRATLMSQGMGLCLFFDDYANVLITGPTMQHITDSQGVSREKLAYIVDSTAAPVAGIAIISSWIAAELSAIETGFEIAGIQGSAYSHFFGSIPYCTYNFLAIAFVLFTALLGREYGPMLAAERRARAGEPLKKGSKSAENGGSTGAVLQPGCIWSAVLPILSLIIYAFVGFYTNGIAAAVEAGVIPAGTGFSFSLISTAFGYANTVAVLMRAAIFGGAVAIFMGCITGKMNVAKGISDWLQGASGILLTVTILVLAWCLAEVIGLLGTAYYLVDLVTLSLPYWLLPMLIFIACCTISFAAGSFGCMVIVMPIAVPIAYSAAGAAGIAYSEQFIFACIAAVLSGSIFGDHCSPVTDTTILSSLGAGCDNIDHVKTQLPYALTVAAIASVLGYLPAGMGVSPAITIPLSIAASFFAIRFIGKKVSE